MSRWVYLIFITILVFIQAGSLPAQSEFRLDRLAEDTTFKNAMEWAWKGKFNPFIEASIGIAQFSQEKFAATMPEESLLEFKLGYSQYRAYEKMVWELDERFIFASHLADNIFSSMNLQGGTFFAKVTRFGFGNRLGYGYHFEPFTIILYNQNGLNWSELRTERPHSLVLTDQAILDRYEGTYRLSINAEGGIGLVLFKSFSLMASYEISVIYPRVIFWPWLGSHVLYQAGMGIVSTFTDDIIQSSPLAGPVFYFLLKNAISYAYYQGVKNKMNWPFNSETPLMIEAVKVGFSYTF
jgi:hypothetical protein